MKNPESCVINSGKTTPYFKLERGTRQEDRILACLFIIALEVSFTLIKANSDNEGIQFFSHTSLYFAYAVALPFLGNEKPATEVIKTSDKFSVLS